MRLRTDALLVRKVAYGEADLVLTLFTEGRGIMSAIARSARRSSRRFSSLEPMHLLHVSLDERTGVELATLTEASVVRPRLRLTGDLDRLDAAGRALRWVRKAAPPHTPEPELWHEINALLDALDSLEPGPSGAMLAASMGLRLLVAVGFGLNLQECVRCGRPCAPDVSAGIDAREGGLVCRACGGAAIVLRPGRRARLLAATLGDDAALEADDVETAMALVDVCLEAHTHWRAQPQ